MPVGGGMGLIGLNPRMPDESRIKSENFGGAGPEPPRSSDGICNIQKTNSYLIDVLGMNNNLTLPLGFIDGVTYTIQWTVPSWKDIYAKQDCSAKTIYPTAVGLYNGDVGKVYYFSPSGSFDFKDLNTMMLCGMPSLDRINPLPPKTCNDTQPPVKKTVCINTDDCVYANEITGENPTCFNLNTHTTNIDGKDIVCKEEQHWCPNGFRYDLQTGFCIFGTNPCDFGYENQFPYLSCNKFPPTFPFNLTKPCLFIQQNKYTQGCCFVVEWSGYKLYNPQNIKIY